jgi:hypothetical protein
MSRSTQVLAKIVEAQAFRSQPTELLLKATLADGLWQTGRCLAEIRSFESF